MGCSLVESEWDSIVEQEGSLLVVAKKITCNRILLGKFHTDLFRRITNASSRNAYGSLYVNGNGSSHSNIHLPFEAYLSSMDRTDPVARVPLSRTPFQALCVRSILASSRVLPSWLGVCRISRDMFRCTLVIDVIMERSKTIDNDPSNDLGIVTPNDAQRGTKSLLRANQPTPRGQKRRTRFVVSRPMKIVGRRRSRGGGASVSERRTTLAVSMQCPWRNPVAIWIFYERITFLGSS